MREALNTTLVKLGSSSEPQSPPSISLRDALSLTKKVSGEMGVLGLQEGIKGFMILLDAIQKTPQSDTDLVSLARRVQDLNTALQETSIHGVVSADHLNRLSESWKSVGKKAQHILSRNRIKRVLARDRDALQIAGLISVINDSIEHFLVHQSTKFAVVEHAAQTKVKDDMIHVQQVSTKLGVTTVVPAIDCAAELLPTVLKGMTYEEEAAEAAYVICRPQVSGTTNGKLMATNINDCTLLGTQWNSGGCIVSVHDPTLADAWIDAHFDHACLVKLRRQGCWGPVAMMLSVESEALAIFGEMSAKLIHQADELANISGFPVIIRPLVDIPAINFKDSKTHISTHSALGNQGSSSGAPPSADQNTGASQNSQSHKKHYQSRGIGASQNSRSHKKHYQSGGIDSHSTDDHQDTEPDDDDKPLPPPREGTNTSQEIVHKSEITLRILVDDQKRDFLKVIIKAKFYPEPNSNLEAGVLVGVDQPAIGAQVHLATKSNKSLEVDSAIGSVGFLAHGPKYLWTEQIIPLTAYMEPEFMMKFISGRTWSGKLGGKLGLAATMDFSAEQGGSSTTEATAVGAAPHWIVSCEHTDDNWTNDTSSFRTSNVRIYRWPKSEYRFHKRDLRAEYVMAVEIDQVQNPPPLSFVYVHQIQSWMAVESKAKVRGINVVIAHYIPDVRTRIPLRILESPKLKLYTNVLGQEGAESPNEQQKSEAPFAVATAVARAQRHRGTLSRVIGHIFTRQQNAETMAVYKHIDCGWDRSNMRWGHTAWPEWRIEPDSAQEASRARWKFDWNFGAMPSSLTDGDPGVAGASSTPVGESPGSTRDKGKGKEVVPFSGKGLD